MEIVKDYWGGATITCDICGEWFKNVVNLEPDIRCPRCDYRLDIVRVCKSCLRKALELIEEDSECDGSTDS